METVHRLAAVLLLALFFAAPGCRSRAPASGAQQRYPLEGTVVAVDLAKRTITIAHQDIAGFMPAMTMPFVVLERDQARLSAIGPGDLVRATLVSSDSRIWLEDLVVVRRGTPAPGHQGAARPRDEDLVAALAAASA